MFPHALHLLNNTNIQLPLFSQCYTQPVPYRSLPPTSAVAHVTPLAVVSHFLLPSQYRTVSSLSTPYALHPWSSYVYPQTSKVVRLCTDSPHPLPLLTTNVIYSHRNITYIPTGPQLTTLVILTYVLTTLDG